jgi:Arc/MetJ family transcription regulator
MRTDVVINDDLMESALRISGINAKREAIEGYSSNELSWYTAQPIRRSAWNR